MSFAPVLSKREKALAVIAGALLVVFVVVGYAQAQSPDDMANQKRNLSDQQSYAKNLQRELDQIKKDGQDTAKAQDGLAKFNDCLAARQADIGTQDFWSKNQECASFSKDVENELQDVLRPTQQWKQIKKNMEDRKREKKNNLDSQVKDILRNDKTADVSALTSIIAQIEKLFAEVDAQTAYTPEGLDRFKDIQADIDGLFKDYYDASSTVSQKSQEFRSKAENQKDYDRNLKRQCEKDIPSQMKGFEKEVAQWQKVGPLPDDVQAAYDKVKAAYTQITTVQCDAMKRALEGGDGQAFNDARQEFYNLQRDFNDNMNEARNVGNQLQQSKDVLREIDQRGKELEKMKKEYDRAVKRAGGAENPEAKQILADIETLLAKGKEAAVSDPQSWWQEYQRDINDLQNNFWAAVQKVQQVSDNQRWLKDIEREIKDRERSLKDMRRDKHMDSDVISSLEGLLGQMKDSVAKAKELIAKGDLDGARDTLQAMDDLRREWEDTSRSLWEKQQEVFQGDQMKREIEFALKMLDEFLRRGKITKEEAAVCRDFIGKVQDTVSQLKPGQSPEDILGSDFEQKGEEVCPFLADIGSAPPPDAQYYHKFIRENVQNVDEDTAVSVLQKVNEDVVSQVIQRLLSDPSAMQNLLNAAGRYQSSVAGTLDAASNFYDEAGQRDLIAKKTEILELNKQLEQLKSQVQIAQDKLEELTAIQDEIAGHNFYGSTGDFIRSEVEQFIAQAQEKGLSKDEIRAKIEALRARKDEAIAQSREAKVKAQIIPFYDTDDNVWYTKYVAPLAKLGIVRGKGDGKSFDPGANVTVAEILTMAFRVSGDAEAGRDSELCSGKFQAHWANKFVAWAQSKHLSIVANCTDVNRPALRWEVAQVLLETANGSIGSSDESCFADVKVSDQPTNSVACRAREAGILKGTDGRANPYNKIIRAEAATMVKQAAEKLFHVDFGAGEVKASDDGNKFRISVPLKGAAEFGEEEEGDGGQGDQ